MKKIFVLVLSVLLALSCLAFTACGNMYGEYKTYSLSYKGENDETITLVAGKDAIPDAGIILPETYLILTLNEDGTGVYNAMGNAVTLSWAKGEAEGLYKIILHQPDGDLDEYNATLKDGMLTVDFGDFGVVLKK